MVSRTVLVTGCSSGIGRASAERLAQAGWTVYATARRLDSVADLTGCRLLELDVTDDASMLAAVAQIEQEEGAVGVLVNNAGYSLSGAVESVALDDARRQFETNVFGLARLTQLVLPGMRDQGWGRIVNVSSMGGKLTFPGGGWYHASKHAVESLSDALRFEVAGFGIDVVVVEPGLIRTAFAETAVGGIPVGEEPYGRFNAAVGATTAGAYEGGFGRRLGGGPEAVAAAIERAVSAKRPRTRYRVTPSATLFLTLRRLLARPRLGRARRPYLPEAVGTGKALGEQAHEQRRGQPDDVQIVALDPLDEGAAAALDRVGARASLPLAVHHVHRQLTGRQLAKGDEGLLVLDDLPARREQAETRNDCVRPAGELLEHVLGLACVRRLAVEPVAEPHRRVDTEHRPLAGQLRHRPRLAAGVLADELDGVGIRRVVLDVLGRNDVEGQPELLEDRTALWARRREQDRVDDVRAHGLVVRRARRRRTRVRSRAAPTRANRSHG